jgi:1-acyl-sn-glycerol-3-phosphate acyltransferase
VLRSIAKLLLKLGGWTAVGGIPEDKKAVLIAAPHTSNWDVLWAICYKVLIGLDAKWFAKHSAFWFPLGNILSAMGAVPIDRGSPRHAVKQAIRLFEEQDEFFFALAPEGTRKKTHAWKTGFYRIAEGAGVPVYLGFLDFGRRRLGISDKIELTGDVEADMAVIREFYADIEGRWPEKTTPVRFP